jgi:hypothetical protein
MTHSGDETLRLHVLNATVVESDRGIRISKASRKRSAGKVDLCACLVMAHSRATWLAMKKKKRAYAFEERIDNLTQIMANDLDVQPDAAVESEILWRFCPTPNPTRQVTDFRHLNRPRMPKTFPVSTWRNYARNPPATATKRKPENQAQRNQASVYMRPW